VIFELFSVAFGWEGFREYVLAMNYASLKMEELTTKGRSERELRKGSLIRSIAGNLSEEVRSSSDRRERNRF